MTRKSDTDIAALPTLFPAVFSAEPFQAHRPLKVGIGDDLVARGVLGAQEVNAALKGYVNRLMYQKCLAAGGARIDLDGHVAGEVSSEQRCHAERLITRIKAQQLAEPVVVEAEAKTEGAVRHAATPPSELHSKVIVMPPPVQTTQPVSSGRLGLAGIGLAATSGASAAPVNGGVIGDLATATDHATPVQWGGHWRWGSRGGHWRWGSRGWRRW